MERKRRILAGLVGALGVILLPVTAVNAWTAPGYTTISNGSEATTILDILSNMYDGVDWGASNINDAVLNGTNSIGNVTATRIPDYDGDGNSESTGTGGVNGNGSFDIVDNHTLGTDEVTDQLWNDGFTTSIGIARFASFRQTFGYYEGHGSGGTFVPLFTADPSGGNGYLDGPEQDFDFDTLAEAKWRWGRGGDGSTDTGNQHSSSTAENWGTDRFVTYRVNGNGVDRIADKVLAIFMEDGGDNDFNDFAVEVLTSLEGNQQPFIPLPAAAWMGLSTLGCLGVFKIRRRR